MSLFQWGEVRLHSGGVSWFRIDCSALSDEDWQTIAHLISRRVKFSKVVGIPKGGLRLAEALRPFCSKDVSFPTLIVDDVLTTGNSMKQAREEAYGYPIGVVLFARGKCPDWVWPVFTLMEPF